MEQMAWTDERLQERFEGIDRRFDEVDRRFDQVDHRFTEVDRRFDEVDRKFEAVDRRFDRLEGAMVEFRREMHTELGVIRSTLGRVGTGVIVGLVGVIAAIFINGGGA